MSSDSKGYYVLSMIDPYQEPELVLRKDLTCDIGSYSAKIRVDLPSYTGDIQTGDYDCDDTGVRITVSRKVVNEGGVLHREMTVRSLSEESLRIAIKKIREGTITPSSREQTVLEMREIALAQVESTNRLLASDVLSLTALLSATERQAATFATGVGDTCDYLAGAKKDLPAGEVSDVILRKLQSTARQARYDLNEFARIKTTRWYRLGAPQCQDPERPI